MGAPPRPLPLAGPLVLNIVIIVLNLSTLFEVSQRRRQCGRVIRAQSPRLVFKSLAMLVNSQLICLRQGGILNPVKFS